MGGQPSSSSFDRAAEFYDRTRSIGMDALEASLDLLEKEFSGRGRVLEIGVGTGMLALPLAERGFDLVGLDLSAGMMEKLAEKAGGRAPFPLVRGDATLLPFADGAFGGGYVRWVLHLIPRWRDAVAEACRVVGPGGVILVEPGSYLGRWEGLWLAMREVLGSEAEHIGLDMVRRPGELDDSFADVEARRRDLPEIVYRDDEPIAQYFDDVKRKVYSWTWRVPDERLAMAVEVGKRWVIERHGALDVGSDDELKLRWRAYDLPLAG